MSPFMSTLKKKLGGGGECFHNNIAVAITEMKNMKIQNRFTLTETMDYLLQSSRFFSTSPNVIILSEAICLNEGGIHLPEPYIESTCLTYCFFSLL